MKLARIGGLLLLATALASGETTIDSVVRQATRLRGVGQTGRADRRSVDRVRMLRSALLRWIEGELPVGGEHPEATALAGRLNSALSGAGLIAARGEGGRLGFVTPVKVTGPAEFPEALVVISGVTVPCGEDETVSVYRFGSGGRVRIVEDLPASYRNQDVGEVVISAGDEGGGRLAVVTRYAVSCVSLWNLLSFAVYRMGDGGRVLAGEHGVWLDAGPWVKVKAGEVRIECLGASIDVDRLVRKHVLRYRIGERGVERIDPVALRPQDFSEEWLSRPWAEVASRSDPASLETLERWHRRLHADFVSGEFDFVQRCSAKTDEWQMGLDLNTTGKPPWRGYLLVRELGDERFEMVDVSSRRQAGCPGESPPGGPGDEK